MQSLRLALGNVWLATNDADRKSSTRDALIQRRVLHAKFKVLSSVPDLVNYLRRVPSYTPAVEILARFDRRLDGLVQAAIESPAGLQAFDAASEEAHDRIVGLANDLRITELEAFQRDYEAQARIATFSKLLSIALAIVLLLGYFAYDHFTKKIREALEREIAARAEAQRSSQARTALLGMVSHELRTPLQTIVGNSELLEECLEHGSHEAESASAVMRAASLISRQLDNLAQYARLSSGRAEIELVPTSLTDLVHSLANEYAGAAADAGQSIAVRCDLPPGADVISSEPIALRQIIGNYLSNAQKYAGPGPTVIAVRNIKMPDQSSILEISVEDHGPGIQLPDRERIWEPYFRGRETSGSRKGSGLGLAVVRVLAETIDWETGVRESPGGGATFYLRSKDIASGH